LTVMRSGRPSFGRWDSVAKPQVLVVDDEKPMRELMRLYLQSSCRVVEASGGAEALCLLESEEVGLVLLDVLMPDLDGWATLERIREASSVPVIMVSARGATDDRLRSFRLGADDFIAKPFDGRELAARSQAVMRRTQPRLTNEGHTLRRGDLVIATRDRMVMWQGKCVDLTPKEFELLVMLAEAPGQTYSREHLAQRLWGANFSGDLRTFDSHVKNLRAALGEGAGLIATIWGLGYRFQPRGEAASAPKCLT